ncbi:hypothetical protein K474DRAFT_136153 [Panus rudis PR-1116 ss-1]|nr:hypothetical protein K474DRAFT_136153 [Panus rudis PR-1116 ss-1]
MSLNLDVLTYILWFLPATSHWPNYHILNMMHTCRALYDAGLPVILNRIDIRLPDDPDDNGGHQFASFYRFISCDKPRRCRLIRSINLTLSKHDGWTMSRLLKTNTALDRFASILACCGNLQTLALPDSEAWMQHNAVLKTLNALTNLRELRLFLIANEDHKNKTRQFLSKLQSPKLQRIILLRHHRFFGETGYPLVIARKSRMTLEFLQFPPCRLRPITSGVYPILKTLILESFWVKTAHIDTLTSKLVRCLPNLEHLLLGTFHQDHDQGQYRVGPTGDVSPYMELVHLNNQEEQYRARMWPRLDTLGGNVYALDLLAVVCPVFHLKLRGKLQIPKEMVMWKEILDDCRPSAIQVEIEPGHEGFDIDQVRTLIPEDAHISHLVVEINLPFEETDLDKLIVRAKHR